jgi:hypothetical protein
MHHQPTAEPAGAKRALTCGEVERLMVVATNGTTMANDISDRGRTARKRRSVAIRRDASGRSTAQLDEHTSTVFMLVSAPARVLYGARRTDGGHRRIGRASCRGSGTAGNRLNSLGAAGLAALPRGARPEGS